MGGWPGLVPPAPRTHSQTPWRLLSGCPHPLWARRPIPRHAPALASPLLSESRGHLAVVGPRCPHYHCDSLVCLLTLTLRASAVSVFYQEYQCPVSGQPVPGDGGAPRLALKAPSVTRLLRPVWSQICWEKKTQTPIQYPECKTNELACSVNTDEMFTNVCVFISLYIYIYV